MINIHKLQSPKKQQNSKDFSENQTIPVIPDRQNIFLSCTRTKEIKLYKSKGKYNPTFSRQEKLRQKFINNPGPGQYQIPSLIFEKKQHISFTKDASRYSFKAQQNPGPGSYDISPDKADQYKSIKFKFSKKNRSTEKIQQIKFNYFDKANKEPGYNAQSYSHIPAFQQKPTIQFKDSKDTTSTFNRSIKFMDLQKKISLGPGQYNSKFLLIEPKERSSTIQVKAKEPFNQTMQTVKQPGPGSYNIVRPKYRKSHYEKASFTKTERPVHKSNDYPGPGKYELKSQFEKKFNYKIIQKIFKNISDKAYITDLQ